MGQKLFFFIFLSLIAPLKLWAASPDTGVTVVFCKSSNYAEIKIKNYPAFEALTCEQVQPQLESILSGVEELSGIDLSFTRLQINNDEYAVGGSQDWRTDLIELKIVKKEIDSQKWQASLAHELGHAIFNVYVRSVHPEAYTLEDVRDYRKIQEAYNELFADVVAGLYYDDPEVMVAATAAPNYDSSMLSFFIDVPTITTKMALDAHWRFSPLRKTFWQKWVVPRQESPEKLLAELAAVFMDDAFTHYKQDIQVDILSRAQLEIARLQVVLGL